MTGLNLVATVGRVFTGASRADLYIARVLASSPVAFWPLTETSGTVAASAISAAMNGVHRNGVAFTAGGGPEGGIAALYDGTDAVTDVWSTTLRDVYDGTEGCMMVWAKFYSQAVLESNTERYAFTLKAAGNVKHYWAHASVASRTRFIRQVLVPSTITKDVTTVTDTDLNWRCQILSWSETADQLKGYKNSSQVGATATGIGQWGANPLDDEYCAIGGQSGTTGISVPWYGWLKYAAVWDRPADAAILALGTMS